MVLKLVFNGVKKGKGFMKHAAHLLQKVKGVQGCGLRKITRSSKVPNYEILGAQHLCLYEKTKFFQSLKGKS